MRPPLTTLQLFLALGKRRWRLGSLERHPLWNDHEMPEPRAEAIVVADPLLEVFQWRLVPHLVQLPRGSAPDLDAGVVSEASSGTREAAVASRSSCTGAGHRISPCVPCSRRRRSRCGFERTKFPTTRRFRRGPLSEGENAVLRRDGGRRMFADRKKMVCVAVRFPARKHCPHIRGIAETVALPWEVGSQQSITSR